jgi:glyoxalase family protein
MDRLKDKKIEFRGPEKRLSEQVITFHDPDGLELELVSHKVQEHSSGITRHYKE